MAGRRLGPTSGGVPISAICQTLADAVLLLHASHLPGIIREREPAFIGNPIVFSVDVKVVQVIIVPTHSDFEYAFEEAEQTLIKMIESLDYP